MARLSDRHSVLCLILTGALLLTSLGVPPTAMALSSGDECSAAFDLNGPRLYLPPTHNASVSGSLPAPSANNSSVVIRFPDTEPPQVLQNDSLAVDGSRWTATFDLASVTRGRTFVTSVQQDGTVIAATAGTIGHPTAALTLQNQTTTPNEPTVTVRQVNLANGGFVALHKNAPDGPVVGHTGYLQPGIHRNVTIRIDVSVTGPVTLVAMPHFDNDCDKRWGWPIGADRPYVTPGPHPTAVTDKAVVQAPTPTPSATPTPSSTPTPTARDTVTMTPEMTVTTGPGFAIGATLAAGAGLMLFLWQRH